MAFLGIKLFGGGKQKTAKKKKEKGTSYIGNLKKSHTLGRNSGHSDCGKLPKVKGAQTLARAGYTKGQKDYNQIEKIKKRYNQKSNKKKGK